MVQLVLGAAREIVINGDIKWFNTLLVSQYIYQLGYQPVVQKIFLSFIQIFGTQSVLKSARNYCSGDTSILGP